MKPKCLRRYETLATRHCCNIVSIIWVNFFVNANFDDNMRESSCFLLCITKKRRRKKHEMEFCAKFSFENHFTRRKAINYLNAFPKSLRFVFPEGKKLTLPTREGEFGMLKKWKREMRIQTLARERGADTHSKYAKS